MRCNCADPEIVTEKWGDDALMFAAVRPVQVFSGTYLLDLIRNDGRSTTPSLRTDGAGVIAA
jgi:hypothetical protein